MTPPDTRLVEEVTRKVLTRLHDLELQIVVGVSNRHAHLSKEDLCTLFGLNAMTVYRKVRQPSDFAAEQTVSVSGPRGTFPKLRLMGPCRAAGAARPGGRRLPLPAPIHGETRAIR